MDSSDEDKYCHTNSRDTAPLRKDNGIPAKINLCVNLRF